MERIDFSDIKITGGFWKQKQELVRNTTVHAVYNRFKDTGRFEAFKGDTSRFEPHIFWDSDVAKWVEGVAYLTMEKREPELEAIVDELVDDIERMQDDNGYFNIFYTVKEPENRFKYRGCHELYCAGHLMEAAVAYYQATGKRKFIDLMCRYADYIEKRFVKDKDTDFITPGHEEIELALVRLAECTGVMRYLELAKFFINKRGTQLEDGVADWSEQMYCQSHLPVREQTTAEGHAVRAVYLYCAMADLALKYGDEGLKIACEAIFDNIAGKKMYITGGIGSSHEGEAFTVDYDLPNEVSYTESCAALGLALFAHRMLLLDADSKYADAVERAVYNGFLSSISLDGKSFYYTNPLEIIPMHHTRDVSVTGKSMWLPVMSRQEVFECSCCPPNIVRFIPSIGNLIYTKSNDTLFIHQYMDSVSELEIGGKKVKVTQKTAYPVDGRIVISVEGADIKIAVRIPEWCESYKGKTKKGYAYLELKENSPVELDFEMKPEFIEADPRVTDNCGRYAVQRGPVVYCMEGVDNGDCIRDIRLDTGSCFTVGDISEYGAPILKIKAYRKEKSPTLYRKKTDKLVETEATLIPYYAFANRGETEMQVWHLIK
ncbi:MAG: glycoside hydrolase family 127 protein [Clostridia bacterium]|nr:glycoside hydrolase family 127 protein [Clostridia bacterium]